MNEELSLFVWSFGSSVGLTVAGRKDLRYLSFKLLSSRDACLECDEEKEQERFVGGPVLQDTKSARTVDGWSGHNCPSVLKTLEIEKKKHDSRSASSFSN